MRKVASSETSRARIDAPAFVSAHIKALGTPLGAPLSPSIETRGELVRGLGQLALKKSIVKAVPAVVGVLELPDGEPGVAVAKQWATAALFTTIVLNTAPKAKQATFEAGAVPLLVAVARAGSDSARGHARTCLTQLAEAPAHRAAIVTASEAAGLDLAFLQRAELLKK